MSARTDTDALQLSAGVAATPRRWMAAVAGSAVLPPVLHALGVPFAMAGPLGPAIALVAIGDLLLDELNARREQTWSYLSGRASRRLELLVAEILDLQTHGPFRAAAASLGTVAGLDLTAEEQATVVRARTLVERIAVAIRDSRAARDAVRVKRRRRSVLHLHQLADPGDDPRTGGPMIRYANPDNLPGWLPDVAEGPLLRTGAVLDDVRRLHSSQIEGAVLLFTLWMRLLLVAFAPLLGAATAGSVPLRGDIELRDLPYVAALACCVVTALLAPWLARAVMRDNATGARVRRALLLVEVPVAVAAILAWPCWPVAVFAAGWTNWWQRPVFNWVKLAAWIAAVSGCLLAGAALAGELSAAVALEVALTLGIVGVIGGSYGAMLPVSASVLARVLVGGLVHPRRARHEADEQLSRAVADLREAARLTERHDSADDAARLREIAEELAATPHDDERWARGVPRDFPRLLELGLTRRAPRSESPEAALRADAARQAGSPPPLTADDTSFTDDLGRSVRLQRRRHARVLVRVLDVIAREAATHGSGPMTVICGVEGDVVRLRFANARRDPPAPAGTGLGATQLSELLERLPGARLTLRGEVEGTFVDLLPSQRRFGVEVHIPLGLCSLAEPDRT